MGLGKTFQTISFLVAMIRQCKVKRVLILAPVAVIENWNRELTEHLVPHVKVCPAFNDEMSCKSLRKLFDYRE